MITPAKLARKIAAREGFTLVEVIIATAIFSIVSLIGVTVFVNVIRVQKRVYLENAIYQDGRFMIERLARAIRQNSIDYEEYYNRLVEGQTDYGAHQGCYSIRFYNPGSVGGGGNGPGAGGLGAYCSNPPLGDPKLNPGCVVDKRTLDINSGQNPYAGLTGIDNAPADANAMCSMRFVGSPPPAGCAEDLTLYDRDELYLINSKGKEKTIFALKKYNTVPEYALGMVRISGEDSDGDDIVDKWVDPGTDYYCSEGFDCAATSPFTDLEGSLDGTVGSGGMLYRGFVPITPQRTAITSLHFYVSPLEDPRKAFAETDPALGIQQQPHVTIVMTLQPAQSELATFAGSKPTITLQTTVTSRVYNEVKNYSGIGNCDAYL